MENMTNNSQDPNLAPTGAVASVDNPGHPQAQGVVQTPVDQNVQTQPGPDAAFAALRQENERLAKEVASAQVFTQDPEIQKFIEQREAARLESEAAKQNLPVEAANRIAALEAQQQAFASAQNEQAAASNLQSFAQRHEMDANALNSFATWMDKTYPDVANQAAASSSFDFKPYLAAFNPAAYAQFEAGAMGQSPSTPVFIPGHGNSTSATHSSDHDKMMAFIKEEAKKG